MFYAIFGPGLFAVAAGGGWGRVGRCVCKELGLSNEDNRQERPSTRKTKISNFSPTQLTRANLDQRKKIEKEKGKEKEKRR